MTVRHLTWPRLGAFAAGLLLAAMPGLVSPAQAQAPAQKPNIMFIMGDDIGWMQPSIYHRGLMVVRPRHRPHRQRGRHLHGLLAMQSCTSGRNAFFTGMYPLCTGMIPPQLPGSPSFLQPGTPALASSDTTRLHHGRVRQEPFGRPHCGAADGARLPGVLGVPLSPGRDAAGELPRHQFSPTVQGIAPPCKNTPVPGLLDEPGAVDPKTTTCLTPPRPVLACTSSDGTERTRAARTRAR